MRSKIHAKFLACLSHAMPHAGDGFMTPGLIRFTLLITCVDAHIGSRSSRGYSRAFAVATFGD